MVLSPIGVHNLEIEIWFYVSCLIHTGYVFFYFKMRNISYLLQVLLKLGVDPISRLERYLWILLCGHFPVARTDTNPITSLFQRISIILFPECFNSLIRP